VLAVDDGFLQSVHGPTGFREITMEHRDIRVEFYRLPDQVCRGTEITELPCYQPQQVECIHVIGLDLQYQTVDCLGFAQPPGLVVLHGSLYGGWNRHDGAVGQLYIFYS
jgi:hypothetical protein